MLNENELWVLSFYRTSEISGALFFGGLARTLRPGPVQHDMTRHFADEAAHAWYWTSCIESLGARPLRVDVSYQDRYLEEAGLPVNVMEVLALTQVFEKRVIGQYSRHSVAPGLAAPVRDTLRRIMEDEKWHLQWIRDALKGMEGEYGAERVAATLDRFAAADHRVYAATLDEHAERLADIVRGGDAGEAK